MMILRNWLISLLLFSLPGCTLDNAQQLAFQLVQNVGQWQCQKRPADDCNGRQSYDAYQRYRQEVEGKTN